MINENEIEIDRQNNYPLIRERNKSYFEVTKSQKLRNNAFIKRCMNLAINAAKKMSLKFNYVELIEFADDQQQDNHFKFVVKQQQNRLGLNKNSKDLKILKAKELSYMSNEYYCVFREASQINDLPSLRRIKFLHEKLTNSSN